MALFSSTVLHCFDNPNLRFPITYHKVARLCNILVNVLQELVNDAGIFQA